MTMMTVLNVVGLYVPAERWKTEHGDYRVSPWGMGYKDEATAREAIAAHAANEAGPDGVLLDEATMGRLRK